MQHATCNRQQATTNDDNDNGNSISSPHILPLRLPCGWQFFTQWPRASQRREGRGGAGWCVMVLAEKVLVRCHYRVPGLLTMITRIDQSDNPPVPLSLSLPASNYRPGLFSLMKIVRPGQSDIQMKPNGNLICLIMPSREERGVPVNYVFQAGAGGQPANYGNQPGSHPNSHSGRLELPRLPSAPQISLSRLERGAGGVGWVTVTVM